jgi:receptor protein-tyrosine kinase
VATFNDKPVYRASMKLVVAQSSADQNSAFGSTQLMQTMTNLLESDVVVDRVIRDLSLKTEPDKFFKLMHVTHAPDSSVLDVSFDSRDKRAAVPVLSRVATIYRRLIDEKFGARSSGSTPQSGALPLITVDVFDPPHLEAKPVSPKKGRTLAFAGALGLAIGLVLAFLREGLDERIRSRADAEDWFEARVIGTLPKRLRAGPNFARGHTDRTVGDALEVLRANVIFSQSRGEALALLITSPMPEDGKSLVAANLSIALATAGEDVIAIDADLRRPSLHRNLGADGEADGLIDVLAGRLDVEDALQRIQLTSFPSVTSGSRKRGGNDGASPPIATREGSGRLRMLAAGRSESRSALADPGTILTGERVDDLVRRLRAQADFLIFDGPPLFLADAFPLAVQADSVLVVARQGWTTRDKARAARATLAGLGVERFGVVLTDAAPVGDYRYR